MKQEYMDRYEKIGLLIAIYRRKRKLTQEKLGDMLNVEGQHISRIERAVDGISFDAFFAIADALEVEPAQLLDFSKLDGSK